jgi:hypothetical protein
MSYIRERTYIQATFHPNQWDKFRRMRKDVLLCYGYLASTQKYILSPYLWPNLYLHD